MKPVVLAGLLASVLGGVASAEILTPARITLDDFAVDGSCDVQVTLFDSASGSTILAGPETLTSEDVDRGWISVRAEFPGYSWSGAQLPYVEFGVRCDGEGSYQTMSPREQVRATPIVQVADRSSGAPTMVVHGNETASLDEDVTTTLFALPVDVHEDGVLDVSIHGTYVVDQKRVHIEYPLCQFTWNTYIDGGIDIRLEWVSDGETFVGDPITRAVDTVGPYSFGVPINTSYPFSIREPFPVVAGQSGTIYVRATATKDPWAIECILHQSTGSYYEYVGGAITASATAIHRPEVIQ